LNGVADRFRASASDCGSVRTCRRPGPHSGRIGHRLRRGRAAVLALATKHGVSEVRVSGVSDGGDALQDVDEPVAVASPSAESIATVGSRAALSCAATTL
jgi:hypothetical protein